MKKEWLKDMDIPSNTSPTEEYIRGFCGFDAMEIKDFLYEEGIPLFRAKQLFDWVYQKGITQYKNMYTIPDDLYLFLEKKLPLGLLQLQKIAQSKDGETVKFLSKLPCNRLIESVLISSGTRRTACISSQLGCIARCSFCASGKRGLFRNLVTEEIVEQVIIINQWLKQKKERVSHIVFMGMGEPLDNYHHVVSALKIFTNPELLNFSPRKITISTVGIPSNIKRLMEEGIKVNLALSLHAPNQTIRKQIIPYGRQFPLEEILKNVRAYAKCTKRDITYEYVLIDGINDQKHHAEELAHLLRKEQCSVNLIPFNPIPKVRFKRPENAVIQNFRDILIEKGICTTWRYTKGQDIAAACGQLALKESE